MKKKIFTLVALLAMVCGANASTTLWEGTDDGSDIYIPKEKLVAGATITLEFNWLSAADHGQYSCFYWDPTAKEGAGDWVTPYHWQWVNKDNTFTFTLTQDQINSIPSQLGFKTNTLSDMTFKKISIDATTTTEWEGTDDGSDIFIDKSRLIAGAPITLEFNWLGEDGAQFACFYYNEGWVNLYDWMWVNNSNTFTFWLTQEQIDAIPSQLGFKTQALEKMTFKKISIFKPSVTVSVGSDGIATFSCDKNLDFSGTGVTPYYVSAVATGTVMLTAVANATTWEWRGYILQGDEGAYEVPVTTSATYMAENNLKQMVNGGTVAASTDSKYHYIFAKNSSGDIGFYKLTADHTLAAHKAYLETDTDITPASAVKGLVLVFDDNQETAIQSVEEMKPEKNIYYNLNGIQVQNPTKGLYIKNGKKIFVK